MTDELARIAAVMRNVVGSPIDDFMIIRAPRDPVEFASHLLEECEYAHEVVELLPTLYSDPEKIKRRRTMHLQRCIVTFIAGGGNHYQMGDRLFAAFDGCEENRASPGCCAATIRPRRCKSRCKPIRSPRSSVPRRG